MSSTAHLPDPQSFQQQSDEFMSWLAAMPGVEISPKVRVADLRSSGAGRGVVAQTNIPEGETLFSIPRNLILSVQNSELKTHLPDKVTELDPWLSLILVMIYEYLQGTQSKWAPYFRILPTHFDTLMFWSDTELQELQASEVVNKIGKHSAEFTILEKIAPIVRTNPALFPPVNGASYQGDEGEAALLELAHRMGSLIMAYAFDIQAKEEEEDVAGTDEDEYMTDDDDEEEFPDTWKGMVPLADLLNADADRNNARLFQEEEAVVMQAIKPIQEGEEIFNDYGDLPRADLLRRYGYITDNYAPFDTMELSFESVCHAADHEPSDLTTQSKLELLVDEVEDAYEIDRPSTKKDSLRKILPGNLVELLTILAATRGQNPIIRTLSIHQPQARILQKVLLAKRAEYATSLDQDRQILADLPPNDSDTSLRRRRMAVQVRIGEKEILQSVLAMLDPLISDGAMKRTADADVDESRQSKTKTARVTSPSNS